MSEAQKLDWVCQQGQWLGVDVRDKEPKGVIIVQICEEGTFWWKLRARVGPGSAGSCTTLAEAKAQAEAALGGGEKSE